MDWNRFFGSHGFTLFLSSSDSYASIAAALSLLCESECRCHSQSLLNFYPLPNPSKSSDSTTICSICICFPNLNQTRFKKQVITLECPRGSSSEKCDVSNDVATGLESRRLDLQYSRICCQEKGRASNHKGRKELLQVDVVRAGFLHLKDFRIARPIVWVMLQSLINAQLTDCCYIDLQLSYRGCIHLLWLMAYANSNQFPICTNATPIYIINESLA